MADTVVVGFANPTKFECVPDFCDRCESAMFVSSWGAEAIREGARALCKGCFAVENTKPKR